MNFFYTKIENEIESGPQNKLENTYFADKINQCFF